VLSYEADTTGTPERAWALMARPALWSRWAPHLRGAWGLGEPEIRPGAVGAARLLGVVPVPAKILSRDDGRSWTWRVGPATLVHRVEPKPGGATVAVDITAAKPVEAALAVTYGPIVQALVKNLARVAAR
jgi:hypothetical protein